MPQHMFEAHTEQLMRVRPLHMWGHTVILLACVCPCQKTQLLLLRRLHTWEMSEVVIFPSLSPQDVASCFSPIPSPHHA